jgi:hypothetical protein
VGRACQDSAFLQLVKLSACANTDSLATEFINPLSFGDEFIFAQFDKRHLGAQIAARAAYNRQPATEKYSEYTLRDLALHGYGLNNMLWLPLMLGGHPNAKLMVSHNFKLSIQMKNISQTRL